MQVNSKENRFRDIFLVNTNSVLSDSAEKPTLPHQVSVTWRAHCMSPDTVFGNLPTAKRQMSSVWPWLFTPPLLSLAIRLSEKRHHTNGDNTPACGQLLDRATTGHCSPHKWVNKFRRFQAALQGNTNAPDTGVANPMSDKNSKTGVKGVIKSPSISIKLPRAVCYWSNTFSTRNMSRWKAVSTDLKGEDLARMSRILKKKLYLLTSYFQKWFMLLEFQPKLSACKNKSKVTVVSTLI